MVQKIVEIKITLLEHKAILSFNDGNYSVVQEIFLLRPFFYSHLHRTNYLVLPLLGICRRIGLLHFTSDGA